MNIKYILIAGGSYAPPHKGHLNNWMRGINAYYKYIKKIDKKATLKNILLIVLPVSDHYKKSSVQDVTCNYRLNLLNILLSHIKKKYNIKVEIFSKKKQLSTAEEIRAVEKKYKIRPALLFGADNMVNILEGTWWSKKQESKRIQFLKNNIFVISCSKKSTDKRGYCKYIKKKFDAELKKLNITSTLILYQISSDESGISSTKIRNNIKKYRQLKDISYLIPFLFKDEINYIMKHDLWNTDTKPKCGTRKRIKRRRKRRTRRRTRRRKRR